MSIDLSLDRLKQLLPHLPYTRPTLHVAGTNGKGSVSALLTSILMASDAPLRVGRFNSPHLVSVLDSITIDNVDISEQTYNAVRQNVQDIDHEQGTNLTSFEILTLTALRIFETQNVDIVVLEVGMGGRLDATNIVPSSYILVSALTSVDLDHQAFLGDTVALIAREKAAIARPRKPFVLGHQLHLEVEGVAKEIVQQVGGELRHAIRISVPEQPPSGWSLLGDSASRGPPSNTVSFNISGFNTPIKAQFPLHGTHQIENLGTALSVMDALLSFGYPEASPVHALRIKERITADSVAHGVTNVKWRGRLSFHSISVFSSPGSSSPTRLTVLADGAHNPASAKTLGAFITSLLEQTSQASNESISVPITYILSLSHSPPKTPLKTLSSILPSSLEIATSRLTVRPSVALLPFSLPDGMPWVKPVALATMRSTVCTLLENLGDDDLWVAPESGELRTTNALHQAFKWAAQRHGKDRGLVVVAGSLYLVADFYRLLGTGLNEY